MVSVSGVSSYSSVQEKNYNQVQSTVTMNKWSLLLFSVLGLLLSTTSEQDFVDGRLGCCDHSSRPLLSDTRISIYEPYCAYRSLTEISQPISLKRNIRYDTRNVDLKRSSRSDGRRRQLEGGRISSNERFRVSSNVVFDLDDSTLSNSRNRNVLRENNDLYLPRNLKTSSRDNSGENHVYRSLSGNNHFLGNKIETNSRERGINIDEEFSEIRDNRFRHNDGPVSDNLKDRIQERLHRRTFGTKTFRPDQRQNIHETTLSFVQKKEGKRDMERSNHVIRQRFIRDTRLTSDLSRNSDRRFKKDDRSSNERYVMQLTSNIGILRNGNIQDYRRSSNREDSIVNKYERESLTNVRRNIDIDGTVNVYRQNHNEHISEKSVPSGSSRLRTIQIESEGSRNRFRYDKRQINSDFEQRLFEERYSTRGLSRQNFNINRHYKNTNSKDGGDYSNVLIERIGRASDQSGNRKIRKNNREIRLIEEYTSERITSRNNLVEKRSLNSNINRRSETIRRSVLESREKENSGFRLDRDNGNIFEQRRIRQIRNSHNEDKLREPHNSQRRLTRSNTMGQEIKSIIQIYDDDNVLQGFLVRDNNNREISNRIDREILSHTSKRTSQIRIIQRENRNKMHIKAMNIQENRIQEDPNFKKRLVSNTNRIEEKRQSRTYNENSNREQFGNSLVREADPAFDESRIRQVRIKREYRREYRFNVERSVDRVLTRIDRSRNNVVERGFLSVITGIGNNRLYGIIQSTVTVLRRRVNKEVRSTHENERILDQRRIRDVLERREDNLSTERITQRNLVSRNSMSNGMLNNHRRTQNDHSQVILIRTNQREPTQRSERERFSSVNKRSSYLRMVQQEQHKNRMHNNYRQRTNNQEIRLRKEPYANRYLAEQDSDIQRLVKDRRIETLKEKLITRNILASENKQSFDKNRISPLGNLDSREDRLNDKVNDERIWLRDNNVSSMRRLNERHFGQNGNGIVRNKQLTTIKDHNRENRIAQIHGLRKINVRSNTRGNQDRVITRYAETEAESHDSHETHNERRTGQVMRNNARHGSINKRDLLEARSERDVNRKLQYIRHARNYNSPVISAHRDNKNNARTSERDNNIERDAQDRTRDNRGSNGLQRINKESRITKTRTNDEEREIRTAFSQIRFILTEHNTQSDNQIFEIKLQYIFYILQGLYIIGLCTRFTENFNGIQKRTRFSDWFPLIST